MFNRIGFVFFLLSWQSLAAKKFFYEQSKAIQEVKGLSGYFLTSKKIRVIEFYSPFCVRHGAVIACPVKELRWLFVLWIVCVDSQVFSYYPFIESVSVALLKVSKNV